MKVGYWNGLLDHSSASLRRESEFLSFSEGGDVPGGTALDFEGIRTWTCSWLLIKERVHSLITFESFKLDLQAKIVRTIGIDQGLL